MLKFLFQTEMYFIFQFLLDSYRQQVSKLICYLRMTLSVFRIFPRSPSSSYCSTAYIHKYHFLFLTHPPDCNSFTSLSLGHYKFIFCVWVHKEPCGTRGIDRTAKIRCKEQIESIHNCLALRNISLSPCLYQAAYHHAFFPDRQQTLIIYPLCHIIFYYQKTVLSAVYFHAFMVIFMKSFYII